ncbi:BatA domain-containing protein, partial [Arenimonas composti]
MSLLLPLGQLALAAWALPLLLHLARRQQQQPVDFAALRWLGAKLRPRQRLRFEEIPLLLARLALLAALALLLAMPVRERAAPASAVTAVHPALAGALPAGLVRDDAAAVWLAPDFPSLAAPAPEVASALPPFSLLRELDAALPAGTPLVVHVPARLAGGDGERPRLARAVDWRVAPNPAGDSEAPTTAPAAPLPAEIELVGEPAQRRWLRAALRVLAGERPPRIVETDTADAALAERIAAGSTALLASDVAWPLRIEGANAWRADDGRVLLRAAGHGAGRVLQWQRPLRPDTLPELLQADFPQRLRTALQASAPAPTMADAARVAPRTGG